MRKEQTGTDIGSATIAPDTADFSRFAIEDDDGSPFAWCYVRVLQDDGEMAWSSPVWIT